MRTIITRDGKKVQVPDAPTSKPCLSHTIKPEKLDYGKWYKALLLRKLDYECELIKVNYL